MAVLTPNNTNSDKDMEYDFHFPSSKRALLIFTRNPELGKVKTRLAKSIGNESALNIYKFLIAYTAKVTKNLNVDKYVFYSEKIHNQDAWDSNIYRKRLQSGEELGERMHNAFEEIFRMGYKMAVIIGCDLYDLEQNDLEKAFDTLQSNDIVIGPALDGGYYLLGMKTANELLFQKKDWGTNTVLEQTLSDLQNEKYILLSKRNDIDYYEDIIDNDVFQQFLPESLKK